MCDHCKSLTCCVNHGCEGNTAPKLSVAELLARCLRQPAGTETSSLQSGRVLSSRELPEQLFASLQ